MNRQAFLKVLGYAELAKLTNAAPSTVANWPQRGIPWRVRKQIARYAEEQGVPLPEGYWE